MRCLDRWAGLGERGFQQRLLSKCAAKDGIDQTARWTAEGNALVHRGMSGGAHVEDLVEAHAKNRARLGIDAAFAQLPGEEIELAQVPQRAKEKLHEKGPVQGGKRMLFEGGVQDLIREIFALLPLEERTETGLARIGGHGGM
jgi:hypothetical protein